MDNENKCPDCLITMLDLGNGDNLGGGPWLICEMCFHEVLPKWHGFQMYDLVEMVGSQWPDGSKVYATVKGVKGDRVALSNEDFFSLRPPETLKLRKRKIGNQWYTYKDNDEV